MPLHRAAPPPVVCWFPSNWKRPTPRTLRALVDEIPHPDQTVNGDEPWRTAVIIAQDIQFSSFHHFHKTSLPWRLLQPVVTYVAHIILLTRRPDEDGAQSQQHTATAHGQQWKIMTEALFDWLAGACRTFPCGRGTMRKPKPSRPAAERFPKSPQGSYAWLDSETRRFPQPIHWRRDLLNYKPNFLTQYE